MSPGSKLNEWKHWNWLLRNIKFLCCLCNKFLFYFFNRVTFLFFLMIIHTFKIRIAVFSQSVLCLFFFSFLLCCRYVGLKGIWVQWWSSHNSAKFYASGEWNLQALYVSRADVAVKMESSMDGSSELERSRQWGDVGR